MLQKHKFLMLVLALLTVGGFYIAISESRQNKNVLIEQKMEQVIDQSGGDRTLTFMPLTGTRWVYEGKRTYYDNDTQSVKEVTSKKVVEVTSIVSEGENVRATYKETYTNDPDFTEREGSFLFSDNAFAFDGETVVKFPLESGQRLSFDDPDRNDSLYDYYVGMVLEKKIFGKDTICYEITYKTLADRENKIFCEGIGYIRDQYVHNGTPHEADYQLVGIPRPEESISKHIPFSGLNNTIEQLPNVPSDEEWELFLATTDVFENLYREKVTKYGELVKRFYIGQEYPHDINIIEADLTDDGIPEQIVSFDGGGTYGITEYKIIQNEIVIATLNPPSVGRSGKFIPDPNGNGFSLKWYTDDMFPGGYCCPVGHMETWFEYKEGQFIPVYEQRVSD